MIGAGAVLGQFTAKLGLDSTSYTRGIINAEGMNRVFGQSFTQFVTNPLLGSIGLMKNVGVAVAGAAAKHLELAETLQRVGQQTGVSEQFLISLIKRLEVAGYSGDIASRSMATFGKNILEMHSKGSGPLKEVADLLGIQINAGDSLESTMGRLLDRINQLPTEFQRSAAAGKVFGEEMGPKLLNAIGGGSDAMAKMQREAVQLGYIVDRTANDNLADMNTQLGYLKLAAEGIKFNALRQLIIGFAGEADRTTDGILDITAGINQDLGPAMRDIGELLRDLLPDIREFASLSKDIAPAVETWRQFYQVGEAIRAPGRAVVRTGGNVLGQVGRTYRGMADDGGSMTFMSGF